MPDDSSQRATVTDPDDLTGVALQDRMQIARTGKCQGFERKAGLAEIGRDLNHVERKPRLERLLCLHAIRDRTVDENADQAVAPGARDQPMCLDGGNVQACGDLALRLPAGIVQPGSTRCEARIIVKRRNGPIAGAHISTL